jgi:hypothetical protein
MKITTRRRDMPITDRQLAQVISGGKFRIIHDVPTIRFYFACGCAGYANVRESFDAGYKTAKNLQSLSCPEPECELKMYLGRPRRNFGMLAAV